MDRLLAVCLALACIVPIALSQRQDGNNGGTFVWNVERYPDPFSYDTYRTCGRSNKSNICDPYRLLPQQDVNRVDRLIWKVFQETRCTCPKCLNNAHGYVIRVAIMPRMESILKQGNTTLDHLKDAQLFAYRLTQKWAMDKSCNESVLILFSRYDGVLYTLTLPHAREVLKDEHVKRITMAVRHLFDDNETAGKGLYEMVERYKLIFDGDTQKALHPRVSPQRGNDATGLSPSIVPLLFTAFLMTGLH